MSEPILSILICTLPERELMLFGLISDLDNQIEDKSVVEVVIDDRVGVSTGSKRQSLLEKARGKYISFIDDDDSVPPYYIDEILKGAQTDCDCMAINGIMTTDGTNEIDWRLSKDNPNTTIFENGKAIYLRTCNHIAPVKRELALLAGFPDISNGEDKEYSERLNKFLKTEFKIEHEMYHYQYITRQKEYLK